MNVLLDYQVLLLPKRDYWKWVRACSKYVVEFGANLTDDPATAIGYMAPGQVISFPAGEGLFPDHNDLESWLQEAGPGIRLDPIDAKSSKDMKSCLKKRVADDDRYGQKQRPFYLLWPTDYPVITQAFGANPQIYKRFGMPGHEGLDIRALTNTNVYACAAGTVYEVHTNPKDHPYGIHVRVRHKDGYRTVYGHLARSLVSVGQYLDAGQVLGKADSTGASTAAHLHLTLERDGATARKETKYPKDVLDPTPFMVWPDRSHKKSLPSLVWPAGRCLVGARCRAGDVLSEGDLEQIKAGGLEAVRVGSGQGVDNLEALRRIRPGILIVAGLDGDLSSEPVRADAFVASVADDLQRLSNAGVNYFQVTRLPNLQAEGWGRSWVSGRAFGEWFQTALSALRDIAPQARFGFPGLASGGDVVGWMGDAQRFLAEAEAAVGASDWVGVNFYGALPIRGWEDALARLLGSYRSSFPNKLLFIDVEDAGGSGRQSPASPEAIVGVFRRLRNEANLGAAFCFELATGHGADNPEDGQEAGSSAAIAGALGRRAF